MGKCGDNLTMEIDGALELPSMVLYGMVPKIWMGRMGWKQLSWMGSDGVEPPYSMGRGSTCVGKLDGLGWMHEYFSVARRSLLQQSSRAKMLTQRPRTFCSAYFSIRKYCFVCNCAIAPPDVVVANQFTCSHHADVNKTI